jgi:glycosyltransferase involved in cell wall biosynthesis
MRVVALAHQYVPARCAGAETMLHSMLRALARRGHDVHVSLSAQAGDPYTHEGVQVWPVQGIKAQHIQHAAAADVLIGHLENAEPAEFIGYLNNIPVAVVNHNTLDIFKRALHFPQARVDLVAVNSEWMRRDLEAWHVTQHLPMPRTVVVRPLVDRAEYAVDGPHDHVTLVNLKRDEQTPHGITLGKGGELFWQLAERMPKLKFLGVKGAYGDQVLGDLPNVEVLDHVPHPQMREKVFARTRILLMPSAYESWGRVGTEALCSGIPVIAHPTPGLQENLGDAGIFVDRSDVDGWCRALRTLAMPRPYEAARRRALARAAELDPQQDLDRWCDAVEHIAARRLVGV